MMVCPYDESCLLLVLQIEHSRVAGIFAAHWGNKDFAAPRPYASMVLAAQEHDNGWWDWEVRPTLNEEGYPPDYIQSIRHLGRGVWLGFYRHGIQRVVDRDPYAGYNVSMHGEGLLTQGMGLLPYMPDYTVDPNIQEDVRQFIGEQKDLRARLLEDLRRSDEYREFASEERLWTNFKLMEVFDQLAQFVCNRYPFNSTARKNGPTNRLSDTPVPVEPGQGDVTVTIDVQDESNATVRPYPFDINPLFFSFPARLVPKRRYSSQEDFLRHFYKAERLAVTYALHAG